MNVIVICRSDPGCERYLFSFLLILEAGLVMSLAMGMMIRGWLHSLSSN